MIRHDLDQLAPDLQHAPFDKVCDLWELVEKSSLTWEAAEAVTWKVTTATMAHEDNNASRASPLPASLRTNTADASPQVAISVRSLTGGVIVSLLSALSLEPGRCFAERDQGREGLRCGGSGSGSARGRGRGCGG